MVQSQGERRRSVVLLLSAARRPRADLHHFSEKSLAALKQARRNKVEDFKKRTNYYETRELLERYEDSPSTGVPLARPIDNPSSRRQSQLFPATPQRAVSIVPPKTPANLRNQPISPGLQRQLARTYPRSCSLPCLSYIYAELSFAETPQHPLPPPRKLWYDKLADALLGDDEPSVNPAAARYALICQKCFAHNGLVKEEMWEGARTHDLLLAYRVDVKGYHFFWIEYVCPKCGYFNPSARSQRKGVQVQPQTPTTQTPQRPEPRDASPQSARRPSRTTDGSPESRGSTAETDS